MYNQAELEAIRPDAVTPMTSTARQRTWKAVYDIKNLIHPGMTEQEAIKKANQYFADHGVKKFWHRTHIRFGTSTVLSFNDTYAEDVRLQEDDIFYIDVGPVWGDIEADCGETFYVGDGRRFAQLIKDTKTIFDASKSYWQSHRPTGTNLYAYAKDLVEQHGYLLHPSYVKGHRLSEFPHFQYTKLATGDLEFSPSPERWILELQICDPTMKFGAFYEDLLD
jgi:Xaa-Pro aminopeptidase